MTAHTHQTAPTQFVEANGIRFAYQRFGSAGGVPLVFNQHFTGTMDNRDPAVTDGLAEERAVILFDNAGVSASSGEVHFRYFSGPSSYMFARLAAEAGWSVSNTWISDAPQVALFRLEPALGESS